MWRFDPIKEVREDFSEELITQLKFKGWSRRYMMTRKEKQSFQEKEQNVQRLVVKMRDPQSAWNTHGDAVGNEPGKAGGSRCWREATRRSFVFILRVTGRHPGASDTLRFVIWSCGGHNMGENGRVRVEAGRACRGSWSHPHKADELGWRWRRGREEDEFGIVYELKAADLAD